MTKGKMIKQLKLMGIRTGAKNNGLVMKLEHLKTFEVFEIWNAKTKTFN